MSFQGTSYGSAAALAPSLAPLRLSASRGGSRRQQQLRPCAQAFGSPASPRGGGRDLPQRVKAVAAEAPQIEKEAVQSAEAAQRLHSQRAELARLWHATAPAGTLEGELLLLPRPQEAAEEQQEEEQPQPQQAAAVLQERRQLGRQASTSGRPDAIVSSTRVPNTSRQRRSRTAASPAPRAVSSRGRRPAAATGAAAPLVLGAGAPPCDTAQETAYVQHVRASLQKGRSEKGGYGTSGDAFAMFLGSLGNTAVLQREQELALARILQRGLCAERALAAVAEALGRQPRGEEAAAAAGMGSAEELQQVLANRAEARDLMLQYNLRLVISIAKRYGRQGVELADLIPEGIAGLNKSIDRFDPDKGFKFSTYAHWWVRQAITRAVADQARVVRLPVHVCETLYRINRAAGEISSQPDRDEPASYEEVAAALSMPVAKVIQYLKVSRTPLGREQVLPPMGAGKTEVSLDEVMEGEADHEEDDPIAAEETSQFIRSNLNLILSTLPKRERNILRLRYGLLPFGAPGGAAAAVPSGAAGGLPSAVPVPGGEASEAAEGGGLSLNELSMAYGLCRERIRQIEEKALVALRKPWRQQLLRELNSGEPLSPSSLSQLAAASADAESGPRS